MEQFRFVSVPGAEHHETGRDKTRSVTFAGAPLLTNSCTARTHSDGCVNLNVFPSGIAPWLSVYTKT